MARTYKSQFLALMRSTEAQMTDLFDGLASYANLGILRAAAADGQVPLPALYDLQQAIGARVTTLFLGRVKDGLREPLTVLPNGSVFPLSPYARVLWRSIEQAQRLAVEHHAAIIERQLENALDVLYAMRHASRNPFVDQVAEQIDIRPNPLAHYDPPHRWVDQNGYRLSDRIWRTSGMTRRKLDLFLDEQIRQGRGALLMSRDLERFLQSGRTLRTKAPYGTDASYDAMRLARTEITRAAAQASEMSALMNPFVEGMEVVLSISHPKVDICDEAAAAGPFPKDAIPAQYQIPMHPHCLCTYRYVLVGNRGEVIEDLRSEILRERQQLTDFIGPVMVEQFTRMLLYGRISVEAVPLVTRIFA